MKEASRFEEEKFVFIVAGEEYECSRFQACFFSKKVCRILTGDVITDTLELTVKDPKHEFKDVLALMNGESIALTRDNSSFLEACARELENDELLSSLIGFRLENEKLTRENVVDRMHMKRSFLIEYDEEIQFAAEHFYELNEETIENLTVDELEEVLRHKQLRLSTEDKLFEILFQLASKDEVYNSLMRYVRLQNLSLAVLDEFLSYVFPTFLDNEIWNQICGCLRLVSESELSKKDSPNTRYGVQAKKNVNEFAINNAQFTGIIAHLRQKCGGNVHEKGIVNITASGTGSGQCHQITNYGWNGRWSSQDQPNSWVQFDFKSPIVCINGYTIKSPESENLYCKEWVIEVSNDGQNWEVIDTRSNDDLKGRLTVRTYQCGSPKTDFRRFVRLRQTGKAGDGKDFLDLSELEFFGTLKVSEQ